MGRLVLLFSMLSLGQAFAQADEWSAFPTTTTPVSSTPAPAPAQPAPAPATPPPAAPAGPPAAFTPLPSGSAQAPISVPTGQPAAPPPPTAPGAPAGPAVAAAPLEDGTVITTRERFVPGTEPHSPSTAGRSLLDPRNLRQSAGWRGNVGVLRLSSADLGQKGLLRFSALLEYFSARDFPFAGAINTRTAGTFGFSVTALDWLELFGSYAASANSNSRSAPTLIQSLGDATLGAKVATRVAGGLWLGLDARALTFSGVGNQDLRRFAWGFAPGALATWDLREGAGLPVRLHLNVFGQFDSTRTLVEDLKVNAAEAYALGINSFHRLSTRAALELPLPYFTPFAEFDLAYPLGTPPEGVLALDGSRYQPLQVAPQVLGFGAKVTAFRDVTFLAAVELGLNRRVALGIPPAPRFNLFFGASFNVDPYQKGETRVVETIRERPPEVVAKPATPPPSTTGKIAGVVLDAKTRKPIPGVMVAPLGLPPVASEPESGRFLTHEIPSGLVKLLVKKDGYRDIAAELVLEPGKVANVELALEALKPTARFALAITGDKKPVAATAMFEGPVPQKVDTPQDAKDPLAVNVEPGRYTVNVSAPGFLAQTREVQLSEGAEMALNFDLKPEPAKKLVVVKAKKIQITEQVHFQTGKAVILEDSFSLLNQVVDAIVRANIKRIRIEGHTDNRGNKLANLRLSQQRALSVAEYLTRQGGIDPRRIEAKGFGDSRPLAPNLTSRGRELNRRVEFLIVEQ